MTYRKSVIVPLFVICGAVIGPSAAGADSRPILPESQSFLTANHSEIQIPETIPQLEFAPEPPTPIRIHLLNAALNQLGAFQDCTDLVQNSLASLGLTIRRDQGGFDYGVQQLSVFGTQIGPSEALPGDIAITGPDNGGHVWIILDPSTNEGVHGGWNGGDTVIGNGGVPITAHAIYRVG